jgi:hypothetical protein
MTSSNTKQTNASSKVIHFRNVANDVTHVDLVNICKPYGAIQNVLQIKAKHQAMLEFQEIKSAIAFMNAYSDFLPTIRLVMLCF